MWWCLHHHTSISRALALWSYSHTSDNSKGYYFKPFIVKGFIPLPLFSTMLRQHFAGAALGPELRTTEAYQVTGREGQLPDERGKGYAPPTPSRYSWIT